MYAPFFLAGPERRLGILMGFTRGSLARGSLTLPRTNAHRLVIIAAALTVAVAAALATALVNFSGPARLGPRGRNVAHHGRQRQRQPGCAVHLAAAGQDLDGARGHAVHLLPG